MLTRGGVGASGRHWLKWFCMRMSEVGVPGNSCRGVSGHSDISELALSRSSNRQLRLPSCCCCTSRQAASAQAGRYGNCCTDISDCLAYVAAYAAPLLWMPADGVLQLGLQATASSISAKQKVC